MEMDEEAPWKCTPASGCSRASFSRGGHVLRSHSAASVPPRETLENDCK